MLILPLRRCSCSSKEKQYDGTEFHNIAIHAKKLLATSVPQHFLQMFTSQKEKLCIGVEKSCVCVCGIHKIELSQSNIKKIVHNS